MAFFKTSKVESNEVVKAEDISYNFDSQVSNFSVLLQGLVDNKHDFVVGGKVSVLSGMNLSIEPILGCCKETGICFVSTEKITEGIAVSTGESQDRIDIVQIKAIEEDYDEQQRSFIDFETKIETVQNVFTKKRVILQVEVKKGVAGSVVAPNTDTGFVKLAEIYVPANTLTIDEWGIYNITANYNGEDNTDWTNEKDRTYDFQYLSDLNKEFQSEHNKDGSHKKGVIGSDELDYGVGGKQINNAILPIGKNITIDNTIYYATTQTATFLGNLAEKISTIFSDYYNKGGKYNFNGELKISDLFSNNALTKPLKIKSDGKGFAYFYIGNKLIFTITESGLFQMPSGYNATATNEVVTKATTDAIIAQLGTINTKIDEIETLINSNQEFVNSVFNRYTFSDKVITVATTANISLSGIQTIDGIALSVGNVVLVKNQTTAKQNGIYEVQTGAWNRLSGFTEFSSIKNKFFTIADGTVNIGKVFFSPQEVCTLGTDNLIFKESFYKNLETKYTVPIRDSNGNIKTGTPSATNDAATKEYVDDAETSAKNLANATGVLSVEKGGTGATTKTDAFFNLTSELQTGSNITDNECLYYEPENRKKHGKYSFYTLWKYINNKISSILGLTASNYGGTSAKSIADKNGNDIVDTYTKKTDDIGAKINRIFIDYRLSEKDQSLRICFVSNSQQSITYRGKPYQTYTSITEAINTEYALINSSYELGLLCVVLEGKYIENIRLYGKKKVAIIGVDKQKCIIENKATEEQHGYHYPPLWINPSTTIGNLTINCYKKTGLETEKDAYCIHSDDDGIGRVLIKNCNMFCEQHACIGFGTREHAPLFIEDCTMSAIGKCLYGHNSCGRQITGTVHEELHIYNCYGRSGSNKCIDIFDANNFYPPAGSRPKNLDWLVYMSDNVFLNNNNDDSYPTTLHISPYYEEATDTVNYFSKNIRRMPNNRGNNSPFFNYVSYYILPEATTTALGGVIVGSGLSVSDGKISVPVATQSANGLMSSTDKTKLDDIEEGANNYSHPTDSGNKHIPSGGSSGQILRWSADGTAVWGTLPTATASTLGGVTVKKLSTEVFGEVYTNEKSLSIKEGDIGKVIRLTTTNSSGLNVTIENGTYSTILEIFIISALESYVKDTDGLLKRTLYNFGDTPSEKTSYHGYFVPGKSKTTTIQASKKNTTVSGIEGTVDTYGAVLVFARKIAEIDNR